MAASTLGSSAVPGGKCPCGRVEMLSKGARVLGERLRQPDANALTPTRWLSPDTLTRRPSLTQAMGMASLTQCFGRGAGEMVSHVHV